MGNSRKNSTSTANRCAKGFHPTDEPTTYQAYHLWGWKSRKTGGIHLPFRLDKYIILRTMEGMDALYKECM